MQVELVVVVLRQRQRQRQRVVRNKLNCKDTIRETKARPMRGTIRVKAAGGLACDEDDAGCDTTIGGSLFQSSLAFAIDFRGRFVQAGLSSVTAENCTDAAREIGRPEMHEDHVVCTFVPLGEPTGECVDPMFVDVPAERSTWHAREPSAVRIGPFDATSTPQRRRTKCHELGVVKHGGRPVHCHVEVAANEVDVESSPRARAVAAGATWRHRASWRQRCASEQCRT